MRVFYVVVLSLLVLFSLVSCKTDETMTIDEIRIALHEGMDKQAVEAFFTEHEIPYGFGTRRKVDEEVPKWEWKSPDAVGLYTGYILHVRTHLLKLTSEGISIKVEIDSNGKVTQAVVKPYYTAP